MVLPLELFQGLGVILARHTSQKREVGTGRIIAYHIGSTRTEKNFASLIRDTVELRNRIDRFIDYYNQTMAKVFKWTYKGKALQA